MTHNFVAVDFLGIFYRAVFNLIYLPALYTGYVVMVMIAIKSGTQSVMLLAVKLLDPRQDAAVNEALKIAIHTGKTTPVKLLLELFPHLFRRHVTPAFNEKLDDRLPAWRKFKPAFFKFL